ncbi:unnamed protein product [Rotaria socialis]
MLDEANNFHPNIKLVRQIGRSVPFLDVLIQNRKGTLTTSVYHKEAAEPYVVPFGSDHPGHVFRNTVDTAIARAVCYSTTLSEFEEEIRQIKLMFLYNGYPSRHIHWGLTTLFKVIDTALMVGTYLNQNLKQELSARMIKHIQSAGSDQEGQTQRPPDKQAANIQSKQRSH